MKRPYINSAVLTFALCLGTATMVSHAWADDQAGDTQEAPAPQDNNPGNGPGGGQGKGRMAACHDDVQKLCSDVQPGGGRIINCLKEHKDQVSDGCQNAFKVARQDRRQATGGEAPPASDQGGGSHNPPPSGPVGDDDR